MQLDLHRFRIVTLTSGVFVGVCENTGTFIPNSSSSSTVIQIQTHIFFFLFICLLSVSSIPCCAYRFTSAPSTAQRECQSTTETELQWLTARQDTNLQNVELVFTNCLHNESHHSLLPPAAHSLTPHQTSMAN